MVPYEGFAKENGTVRPVSLIQRQEDTAMKSKDEIEQEITGKMTDSFQFRAKNPQKAIHWSAAAGAGICAILPVGLDAWALRLCEVVMVICIASLYGEKLTKSAARGIMASSFAQLVGEAAAYTALEAANAAGVLTPAAAYAIKMPIAVGLIEAVGHAAWKHYAGKARSSGEKRVTAFDVISVVGVAADAVRVAEAVNNFEPFSEPTLDGVSGKTADAGNDLAFCGLGRSNVARIEANGLYNDAERLEQEARRIDKVNPVEASRKREQARQKEAKADRIMKTSGEKD